MIGIVWYIFSLSHKRVATPTNTTIQPYIFYRFEFTILYDLSRVFLYDFVHYCFWYLHMIIYIAFNLRSRELHSIKNEIYYTFYHTLNNIILCTHSHTHPPMSIFRNHLTGPYGDTYDMIIKFGQTLDDHLERNCVCNLANTVGRKYNFAGKFVAFTIISNDICKTLRTASITFDYCGIRIQYIAKNYRVGVDDAGIPMYCDAISYIGFDGCSYCIDDTIYKRLSEYVTKVRYGCVDTIIRDVYRASFFLNVDGDNDIKKYVRKCGPSIGAATEFTKLLIEKCVVADKILERHANDKFRKFADQHFDEICFRVSDIGNVHACVKKYFSH